MKIAVIVVISVILVGVLVFSCLFLFGCTPFHIYTKAKSGQVKVACVGDSLTNGMTIVNVLSNSYPAQLQDMLGEGYHVQNFGYNGKTVNAEVSDGYVKTKHYEKSIAYAPDVVIIMLGSNDTKSYNWVSKEYFKETYKEIILSYVNLESAPRVIVSLPNYGFYVGGKTEGDLKYDINGENLATVVEATRELAVELSLEVVDTYELTRAHQEWYKFDGVHPNKDGAKAMAELYCKAVKK